MKLTDQDPATARAYILGHDTLVKQLNRKRTADLKVLELGYLRKHGIVRVYGGPASKDEFIHSICELEFPDVAAARAAYYASVSA